jgi:hypothetical protein
VHEASGGKFLLSVQEQGLLQGFQEDVHAEPAAEVRIHLGGIELRDKS